MRPSRTSAIRLRGVETALVAILFAAAAAGCDRGDGAGGGGHTHGHGHGGHAEADHGGEHHGSAAFREVVYASGLELFAEYPVLVAGRESTFSAHVSTVDGYDPADDGSLAVVLTGESAPGERFEADEPVSGGLYQPTVRPEHTGTRHLIVVYRDSGGTTRFRLGDVKVHASAPAEPPRGESGGTGGISFSKEQQWKVDFATGTVEERSLKPSVPAQGIVRAAPDATARLRAPFAGRILEPTDGLPDVGDRVEEGQRLAVVAPTVDANALPMLRADLTKAKTERKRLKRNVERLRKLAEEGAVPKQRLLDAQSDLRAARADVEAARQRIQQYRSFDRGGRGAAVYLRAPTAGRVVARTVTGGEYVEAGDVVLHTLDESRLRLEARVAEANLPDLEAVSGVWFEDEGGTVVEIDRKENRFFARLHHIDAATRTTSIWFGLPDDHPSLTAGEYHRVYLRGDESRKGLAVPASALLEKKGVWTLFVAAGPESFERRRVAVGVRDGEFVEVVDGLEPGERVVTRGAYYVELASATSGIGGHHH